MSQFRVAEMWEDGLRTDPAKKSFEWWYFDSSFSDGTTVVVTFFTKSASNPGGPIKPQVQITITKPNGEKLAYSKIYAADELSAKKEQCDVKIGPNSIKGNLKKYNIHIELPEIVADIEFDRVAPSFSTYNPHDKGPVYLAGFAPFLLDESVRRCIWRALYKHSKAPDITIIIGELSILKKRVNIGTGGVVQPVSIH